MQITSKTELFQDSSLYVLSKGQVRMHGIREAFNTDRTKYIIAHFKTKSDRILSKPAVSGVLGHGFPLPLNPTVENTTWTLHSDTDGNEFWDLTHNTNSGYQRQKTHAYIYLK